jgi:ABC-type antimicrobial peptide transport system permease subunit
VVGVAEDGTYGDLTESPQAAVYLPLSQSVSRRMKELGTRVALGERKTQLMSAAVGCPMVLLGVGSVLGLLAGIFASRLLGQIVYQANPRDPVVVGGAALTMALLGIAGSAIPTRRALAVDPSKLMREE